MTYTVKCSNCDFRAEEENPKLAMALHDLHKLYNGHSVETYVNNPDKGDYTEQ